MWDRSDASFPAQGICSRNEAEASIFRYGVFKALDQLMSRKQCRA